MAWDAETGKEVDLDVYFVVDRGGGLCGWTRIQ